MTAVRIFRLALGALGLATLAYGVNGLFNEPEISDRAAVGQWLVGGVIGHDFIIAPVVFVLGAIVYRFTSARWRGRLAALLLIGGSLFLISIPALLRQGMNANPTVLPFDYARNLSAVLAVLVAIMAVYGAVDARRRHRRARRLAAATEILEEPGKKEAAADAETDGEVAVSVSVAQELGEEELGEEEPGGEEPGREEEQDGDPRSE